MQRDEDELTRGLVTMNSCSVALSGFQRRTDLQAERLRFLNEHVCIKHRIVQCIILPCHTWSRESHIKVLNE